MIARMATTTPETTDFDSAPLHRLLDGRYGELRSQYMELLCRPEFAPVGPLPSAEYRERVMDWAQTLVSEGLTAPGFPEEYGGQGDPGANVAAFETIGFGDLSLLVKFGVQFGLWGGAVQQLGTKIHHERYLKRIATLELPGCFAMTEAGHGSNVQELQTTATYDRDSDEFIIDTPAEDAHKEYIGNAACHGRMAVVRVPRDALLDRYGGVNEKGAYESPIENASKRFFTMVGTLVQGRVCISGASVSAAKSALTIAVRYGLRRRQFGPDEGEEVAILDYRAHQRRLMPLLAKTYALHFAQAELLEKFDEVFRAADPPERSRRELETLAAGMKATASWHATETIQTCRECCGGAGYMYVNRFAPLKADTDVFTTFEGDNVVLLMLVAKGRLTDYRDHFNDLNPRETVTFVAEQAVETVVERLFARKIVQVIGDFVTPGDEKEDLLDHDYQLELFRWREGHMTASIAQRFRRGLGDGYDAFEVFRAVQDHAIRAARAHMETVLLEAFLAAIDGCEAGPVKDALIRLCDLYALHNIEADCGFFQEHGRLTGPRCKAITREVNRLCNEIRGQAGSLVDAVGIPDSVLGAPIGRRQGATTASA
jgi:acyl-CoA oxidase